MLFIGIDLGTSAVKLLLMDENGKIHNIVSKEYPLSFPEPGWAEQNPEDWLGKRQRVFPGDDVLDLSLLVHQQQLDGGGAQVDSNIQHVVSPYVRRIEVLTAVFPVSRAVRASGWPRPAYRVQAPLPGIRSPAALTTVKAEGSMGMSTVFVSPAPSSIRRKPQRMGLGGASGDASSFK